MLTGGRVKEGPITVQLLEECRNLGIPVTRTTTFWTLAPDIRGPSVFICLYVTLLLSRILKCLLDFWKICTYQLYIINIYSWSFCKQGDKKP